MFIGKIFPIALLVIANSTLAFKLATPLYPYQTSNIKEEQPSVDIRKTTDGQLIAVVKNHTAYPKTIFALQTANQDAVFNPIVLNNVEIIYSGECVTFRSRTNSKNVVFKLTNSSCPIPTGNIGIFRGYGLIKQQRESTHNTLVGFAGPIYPPITELVFCDCVPNATPDGGNCTAGGTGSTQCSYSENLEGGSVGVSAACTVTCGDGHYACCSDN